MVERFNRHLAEALRALPPIQDNIRTGTKFENHAERTAFLADFVADDNRTRFRCPAYQSPIDAVTNLTQGSPGSGGVGAYNSQSRA